MVANQILPSGGLWLNLSGTELLLDPGPGTIVQSTKRNLRAEKLSAIILSHRHLDHSGDMNIMVEAMTQGGWKRHGRVFAPADAFNPEPVLFSYLRQYLDGVEILQEGKSYQIDSASFNTPIRHIHPVETYGMQFTVGKHTFAYIADTRFFEKLLESYRAELLIINVVFLEPKTQADHLAIPDARRIIAELKPEVAILTHFGMSLWRARPWEIAEEISQQTGVRVLTARAGLQFDLSQLDVETSQPER